MRTHLAAVVGILVLGATAHADPLDHPFAATPAELLAAAGAVTPSDDDAIVLRQDMSYRYDDRGRVERVVRVVALIQKPAAIDEWGSYGVSWSPFYEDKPTVRARVIAPDGGVAEIDPALITDTPAVSESPSVVSDRRNVQVPLPRLVVGSVVEEEYTLSDREPLLAAGTATRVALAYDIPVLRSVVTVSGPTSRTLHLVPRGLAKPPVPRKQTAGGRTTWTYDLGPQPALTRNDPGLPGDATPWPYLGIATASDWSAVARDYRRAIDERTKDGLALPDGVRGATPRETVDRAVAWLHAHVRYTGIELSDSAILPWAPADVAARGFGDCKDKAALLVALLRAAGLRADLAVLSDGGGVDVDRALPGMGPFDHAIVRARVDGADLWIDATEADLPAGQLPGRDQGRLALVIADDTRDLVAIPAAPAADNLIREERTYHLAELDHGSVTELTVEHGLFWDNLRTWTRDHSHADLTTSLSDYATHSYDGALASISDNHPTDVTQPFELTLEIADVARAHTSRRQIDVQLYAWHALSRVPGTITDEGAQLDTTVASRTADYVWFAPHVYEIENRLVVPPGFTPPPLVAHEERALGTMTLTTTRAMDHGNVVVTYRLDTGPRRITAAQLAATRAAVRAFGKENVEELVVPLDGAVLSDQGKIKEAIAEYQRLIALHPKEAVHWGQLAMAYERAGMGAAARRAALEGTRIEPGAGDGWALLAAMLSDDSTGRMYGVDSDRAGAIAAYRKALALRPTHLGALAGLAGLLATDAQGALTTNLADRREALALRRKAVARAPDDDDKQRAVVESLLDTGAYADADAAAQKLADSDDAFGLQIAAAALARSPRAALDRLEAIRADAHVRVLGAAVRKLIDLREYDAMLPLYTRLADLDKGWKTHLATASRLTRIDLAKLGPADPMRVAILAYLARLGQPTKNPPWDAATALSLARASTTVGTTALLDWRSYGADGVIDEAAAASDARISGDARDGWRVGFDDLDGPGALYVVLDHGRARLVGGTDLPAGLGAYALGLLARNDTAGAARWLDQLAQDLHAANTRGLTGESVDRYLALEGVGDPSRELVERTAAMFAATRDAAAAAPILRRCPGATTDADRAMCRAALYAALEHLGKWNEILEVADKVTAPTHVDSIAKVPALLHLKRPADAAPLLDDLLAASPHDRWLLEMRARIAELIGGPDDAKPFLDQIVGASDTTVMDLNNAAWTHLAHDASPDEALAIASRAAALAGAHPRGALENTLAAARAQADQPWEAWQALQQSIDARVGRAPDASDWYVLGRIAESYGLRDDAIADYRRAAPDPTSLVGESGWDLAQHALARLKAAPQPHI